MIVNKKKHGVEISREKTTTVPLRQTHNLTIAKIDRCYVKTSSQMLRL